MPIGAAAAREQPQVISRPASSPSRPSDALRAAASSMASGMPSRRAHTLRPPRWRRLGVGRPGTVEEQRLGLGAGRSAASSADRDSGGTVTIRSPGTASRSRLVASTVSRGSRPAAARERGRRAPSRCSQLSSTSSDRPRARYSCRAASSGRPGRSVTPSTAATAWVTKPSRTGTRSTKTAPNGYWPAGRLGCLGRQPGLAHPAGPDQAHHPALRQRREDRALLPVPADEARPAAGRPGTSPGPSTGGLAATAGARSASARRSGTANFRSSDETWLSTVRTEMCSRVAIWALLRWPPIPRAPRPHAVTSRPRE